MSDLDPNLKPDEIVAMSDLPKEVRDEMRKNLSLKKGDMLVRIACMELGFYNYSTEQGLCDYYNITPQQLAQFKRANREDIEKYKEKHKSSKLKLTNAISDRMTYADAYAKAVLTGDKALADKLKIVLVSLDKLLPMSQLQTIGSILEKMDDTPKGDDVPRGTININVNSPAQEAQKRFEEKMRGKLEDKKQVDV